MALNVSQITGNPPTGTQSGAESQSDIKFPLFGTKQKSGGVDISALMDLLILVSPLLEMQSPGAGMGTLQGVVRHQASEEDKRKRSSQALLEFLLKTPPEHMEQMTGALVDMGEDPKIVRQMAAVARRLQPQKSPVEQAFEKLLNIPELAEAFAFSKATGQAPESFITPDAVRGVQGRGLNIPFEVRSQDVVTGTREIPGSPAIPEQIFTAPKATPTAMESFRAGERGQAFVPEFTGMRPGQAAVPARQEPIVEKRERVVVRGARENAIPSFGDLFPKSANTPFGAAKIPVDSKGNPDINEASQIAQRMGWIVTEEDLAKQRSAHADFLRKKLVAGLRAPGSVHLSVLRAQIDDLGMSWPVELQQARDSVLKTKAGEPVEVEINGQPLLVPQSVAAQLESRPTMVTITDPKTGKTVRIPATSLPSFFPRRAPGEGGEGGGVDRAQRRQLENKQLDAESALDAAEEEKRFLLGNVPPKFVSDPADPEVRKPNPAFTEWRKQLYEADNRIRKSRATLKVLQRRGGVRPEPSRPRPDSAQTLGDKIVARLRGQSRTVVMSSLKKDGRFKQLSPQDQVLVKNGLRLTDAEVADLIK